MRPMLLALILCGALAVPLLAQTAPEQGTAPKAEAGAQKKPDQQGDDKKGDKKDDKGDKKDEKGDKKGGKEVKIIAEGPWMMPPMIDPTLKEKEKTAVLRGTKDFLKMSPFDRIAESSPPGTVEKTLGGMLKQSLKTDVDFDKQMLLLITLNQPPMPGISISITKAEVIEDKLMVYYTVKNTIQPGAPAPVLIPSMGTVALIEKFEGKVEFTKVDSPPDFKVKPPLGPDGKPLPVPVGPDGKPLPVPIGPDGKPLPLPKPPVGPDGKPLPIPPGTIGPDGKPLPPPKIEPAPKVPGAPGQPPAAGTPLPGLPGTILPTPTDTLPPAPAPAPKPATPPQPAPAPAGG